MRALVLCALIGIAAATPNAARAAESERTHDVVKLCNRLRVRMGLPPLKVNLALSAAAAAHARDMARRGYFAHAGLDGLGPDERCRRAGYVDWTGENLYLGAYDAIGVVRGWMESPAHRLNILRDIHREVGVAYATGRYGEPYWVQLFGGGDRAFPIVIEDEAWATSRLAVRVYLHGKEKATRVRFRSDSENWSEWKPFRTAWSYSLAPGRGMRTVSVEICDSEGNITRSSDAIYLRESRVSKLARVAAAKRAADRARLAQAARQQRIARAVRIARNSLGKWGNSLIGAGRWDLGSSRRSLVARRPTGGRARRHSDGGRSSGRAAVLSRRKVGSPSAA